MNLEIAVGKTTLWAMGFEMYFPVVYSLPTDKELERWANGTAQRKLLSRSPRPKDYKIDFAHESETQAFYR